ncbi:hypothetical protein BTR23_07545 [Alkalihalophilus pseudofirmus]|nr:hypothetical protein BTR23_07545 [Alkalihalophilus pseudofirmus]
MKTYNFQNFIKGELDEVKKKPTYIKKIAAYSFIFSPTSILHPPPMIMKGYYLMIGIGVTVITLAFLEKQLGVTGHIGIAKTIFNFLQITMPLAIIAALIMFVYLNPLL